MAVQIRLQSPDVHIIFGCVCYRDPVDSHGDVHQVHQLEEDIDALVTFLSGVHASGGGDEPEDWVGGYDFTLHQIQWRDAAKAIVHIADAPAHGALFCGTPNHQEQEPLLAPLIQELAAKKIALSCLDINHGAAQSFGEVKRIYDEAAAVNCSVSDLDIRSHGEETLAQVASSMAKCAREAGRHSLAAYYAQTGQGCCSQYG
jgi:hypothetical protein